MEKTVCPKCKHLYGKEGAEKHKCPTKAYEETKRKLIENALKAEEYFTTDELERGW